jgi:hypothetical protein
MPHRRFDWHEHLIEVAGEYKAARLAVDRLTAAVAADPSVLGKDDRAPANLRAATQNLEGTYLVRLFAAFEAALRSYDRARHNDPRRKEDGASLIDSIGGRRGQGISSSVREDAQAVRQVRNRWAHEDDASEEDMGILVAAPRLHKFLSWLPLEWMSFDLTLERSDLISPPSPDVSSSPAKASVGRFVCCGPTLSSKTYPYF